MIKLFSVVEGENLRIGTHFQSREPLNKAKGHVIHTAQHSIFCELSPTSISRSRYKNGLQLLKTGPQHLTVKLPLT